jgi:ComF family protein
VIGGGALAVCCLGTYRDDASRPTAVAGALHHFKYGLDRASGRALRWLAKTYSYSLDSTPCDLIVPVPLTRSRLRSRGFNQAAWIARGIAASLDLPVEPDALARVRGQISQTGLAGSARRRQVGTEFQARPADISGANILLADDVVTTGTTLANCAEELLRAGARTVTGVTLLGVAEYHAMGASRRGVPRPPTARLASETK